MTYTTAKDVAEAFAQQYPTLTSYPDDMEITLTDNDIAGILNGKTLWETESGNDAFNAIQDSLRDALEHDIKDWDELDTIDFDETDYDEDDIVDEAWDLYCNGKITSNDEIDIINNSPDVDLVAILYDDETQGSGDRSEDAVKKLQEELPFDIDFDTLNEAVQNTPSDFRDIWMLVSIPLKEIEFEWKTLTVTNPTAYIGNALMGGYFDFVIPSTVTVHRDDVQASISWKESYDSNSATMD